MVSPADWASIVIEINTRKMEKTDLIIEGFDL
jgi:hypothetical protein